MLASRWYTARAAVALAVVTISAYACTEQVAPTPASRNAPTPGTSSGPPIELTKLTCFATVATKTVSCFDADKQDDARGSDPALAKDIVYGGQNQYVTLTSSNNEYNSTTHKFVFDVTVRNLIPQAIGTSDGTTADPGGIKVFFPHDPTVTGGTGTVTIDNADGIGSFTGANQPYYKYVQLLDQFDLSSAKTWQFDVPPSVATFVFQLYVSSPVEFPTGWITVSHPTYSLRRTYTRMMTATVYDQLGHAIPGAVVTWSSANTTLATVPVDSGLVLGVLPGAVDIIATSTNNVPGTMGASQTGASHFTITGTSLVWTAGASTTDWNTGANWDRSVSPVAQDSALIPAAASLDPVFVQNQAIGKIEVEDAASVTLGVFDLTASQDALAGATSGGIVGSSGRLFLTGSSKLVTGRTPRMRVTGTYSLSGNLTAVAPLRVESGRLRNTAFRIRVQ